MAARKKAAPKAAKKKTTAKPDPRHTPRKQPETLRLRSVSAGLTVNDIQRSVDFYTRVLGFTAGDKWEDGGKLMGLELKAGYSTIWINQDDFAKGTGRVKGVGVRLYLNTAQDIDSLASSIKKRGGTLDHDPQDRYGSRDFGLTDPDGYKVTIQSA